MFQQHHFRGQQRFFPGFYPYSQVPVNYVGPTLDSGCSCKNGDGLAAKIKENPLVFVIGALAVGYLLAKKR